MNDKSKVTSLFKRAEENPRQEFSLPEIGVSGVSEHEKLQIVHNYDETLALAARFSADEKPIQAPEELDEAA
jgi:hypothetical protein